MYKICKVVLLPTNEKKSCLLLTKNKKLVFYEGSWTQYGDNIANHLYILSDDEIKEGDWCEADSVIFQYNSKSCLADQLCQKIIATTDSSLNLYCNHCGEIKQLSTGICVKCGKFPTNSLLSIPQSFIDKYISEYNKGRSLEEVMVEYDIYEGCNPVDGPTGNIYIGDIKLNPDNTINIKPSKDSWTREEVIELLHKFNYSYGCSKTTKSVNHWIENNF